MQKVIQNEAKQLSQDFRTEVVQGLLYIHTRINANTTKTLEASSFLYALVELLNEKGILTIEELDERKNQVAQRLVKKFVQSGIGLMYQDPEEDKYEFEHEGFCGLPEQASRMQAICCKLPFAQPRQDVSEWIVRWEFSRPCLIAHRVLMVTACILIEIPTSARCEIIAQFHVVVLDARMIKNGKSGLIMRSWCWIRDLWSRSITL
jgi:hypothetical protein